MHPNISEKGGFMETVRLGFVGLGNMGLPMALRLMDQGYSLTVFDIRKERLHLLVARGARAANSPAEVASEVQVVLVNLPTPEVVREVALGPDGIIEGSAVRIYADLSTTGPKVAEEVSNGLEKKGIAALAAPVSGGVPGAEKGTLTVMASGSLQGFEQIQPILKVLGKNVFYLGEKPGLAQTMKLINNLLSGTAMLVTCEAFVLGVKAGLDPEIMLKIINLSTGRNSATEDKFPRAILPRTFTSGSTINVMYKDTKLCLEEAEALGVPMWVGNVVRQLFAYAISQGGGPRDGSTIIQYIEAWAGVQVGKVAPKDS
jgi:3-hydroxyisobutyrate dehydrogenase-like beta-hydroxyacid dehydrogenase